GDAADLRIELTIVEGDGGAPDLGDLAEQHGWFGDRLLRRRYQLDAFEKTLELIGPECGENDLAERRAMCRTHHADAIGELECARAAGARDHHDRIAHPHRKVAAFAGFP